MKILQRSCNWWNLEIYLFVWLDTLTEEGKMVPHHKEFYLVSRAGVDGNPPFQAVEIPDWTGKQDKHSTPT